MTTLALKSPKLRAKARLKGGSGSGFHGHAGRPGEVGGSSSDKSKMGASDLAKLARKQFGRQLIDARVRIGGGRAKVDLYLHDGTDVNAAKALFDGTQFDVTHVNENDVMEKSGQFYDCISVTATSRTGIADVYVAPMHIDLGGGVKSTLKVISKQAGKIVAKQGASRYLVDVGDGQGRVVDTDLGVAYKPFNIQSIIARGYWKNYDEQNDDVMKLL